MERAHGTSFDCIIRECRLVGERWAGSNSELGEQRNAPPDFDMQCALNQLITQLWLDIKLCFFYPAFFLKEKPDVLWFPTLPPSSTTSSWETLVKSNICIFYFPCGVTFFSHHPALHVCRRSCCCVCTRSHSGGGSQGCLRFCTLARFLFKRDVRRVLLSTLETTQITTGRLQTSACTKTPPAESDVLLRFKSLCFCFSLGILIILFLPLWGFFIFFIFIF